MDDGELLLAWAGTVVAFVAIPALYIVVILPWTVADGAGTAAVIPWTVARVCAAVAAAGLVLVISLLIALPVTHWCVNARSSRNRDPLHLVARATTTALSSLSSLAGRVALLVLLLSAAVVVLPPAVPIADVGAKLNLSSIVGVAALQLGWSAVAVSVATPFLVSSALWGVTSEADGLTARVLCAAFPPIAGVGTAATVWTDMVGNVLRRWVGVPQDAQGSSDMAASAGFWVFLVLIPLYVWLRHAWSVWHAAS